jgi:hypothetical protein
MLKKRLPCHEIKVYKLSDKRRQADIYFVPPQIGDEREDPILLDEWDYLEPTTYPFDTEAPAMFNFDIDMEQFLIHIGKLNSIQARKQAPIIVEEMLRNSTTTGRHTKKDMVLEKLKMHPDESNSAIALLCDCSDRYVREIKKEREIS